jgi:hypothetical protein
VVRSLADQTTDENAENIEQDQYDDAKHQRREPRNEGVGHAMNRFPKLGEIQGHGD